MLPLVAILLASLFGIAALAIDIGLAGASRLELESAADALALGAPAEALFDDTRALYEAAAARAAPLVLSPPRAITDADGRRGFERTVPLLFGQGTWIAFASAASGDEILRRRREGEFAPELATGGLRERGMPVAAERVLRAARAELAIRVGVAHEAVPGRADFALAAPCWSSGAARLVLAAGAEAQAFALVASEPADAALDPACPREAAGHALAPASGVQWIGDRIGEELATQPAPSRTGVGYVPLFAPDTQRVLGFARAEIVVTGDGVLQLEPRDASAAPNASALRVSARADAARDARVAAALAERAAFRSAHAEAASSWLRAAVLAETLP